MKLKSLNRNIHTKLEFKKKEVETEKCKIDNLQLKLENLLYKQAHLKREIKSCKDAPTPMIAEIEKELNSRIGTVVFRPDLETVHNSTIESLQEERQSRIRAQSVLQDAKNAQQSAADQLEKKRKFLDEIPARVASIKASTTALQTDIEQILKS